jgi:hypothetical protein
MVRSVGPFGAECVAVKQKGRYPADAGERAGVRTSVQGWGCEWCSRRPPQPIAPPVLTPQIKAGRPHGPPPLWTSPSASRVSATLDVDERVDAPRRPASRRDLRLSGATISLPSALERWSRLAWPASLVHISLHGNQQSRHTRSSPAVSASHRVKSSVPSRSLRLRPCSSPSFGKTASSKSIRCRRAPQAARPELWLDRDQLAAHIPGAQFDTRTLLPMGRCCRRMPECLGCTSSQSRGQRCLHRAAGCGVHGRCSTRGERRGAHRRRRQARHQAERLAVRQLRWRVFQSQPKLCRQRRGQSSLVVQSEELFSKPRRRSASTFRQLCSPAPTSEKA